MEKERLYKAGKGLQKSQTKRHLRQANELEVQATGSVSGHFEWSSRYSVTDYQVSAICKTGKSLWQKVSPKHNHQSLVEHVDLGVTVGEKTPCQSMLCKLT